MGSYSSSVSAGQGFNGDVAAPIAGVNASQANAENSDAVRTGSESTVKIDRSTQVTDSRNFGYQLGKVGNNSTVSITSSDPAVAMMAMQTAGQASRDALAANLATQVNALATVENTAAGAFGLGQSTIAAFEAMDQRRQQAVTNTINAATDQAREAAARSESVVQSALTKLADQRSPINENLLKLVLGGVALVAAVVLGLRAWRGR